MGKGQIATTNQGAPSQILSFFSREMYLHLVEIAVYLWLESIGDATEFQFAFRSKITWNCIFQASNCRRIILIFSLLEEQQ